MTLWTLVYVHRISFSSLLIRCRMIGTWDHAGRIGYLNAMAELVDYRKVNGASESVLRGLASTEIYLKKVRKTVSKMMRLQWTSELDIDALEAKGHWATLEELLEVVGRYLPRYESVLKSCKEKPGAVLPIDLSFATKFLAVYLFIKVKGSRPMTHQCSAKIWITFEVVLSLTVKGHRIPIPSNRSEQ